MNSACDKIIVDRRSGAILQHHATIALVYVLAASTPIRTVLVYYFEAYFSYLYILYLGG